MTDNDKDFVNPYWHRLAATRPRLADHAKVNRQEIRRHLWFVARDDLSGRQFRMTPEAWYFVALLDGTRTVDEAMIDARTILADDAPDQSAVIRLLRQLNAIGALATVGEAPDTAEMSSGAERMRRRRIVQQFRSPLAVRFPIFDPDKLLERLSALARLMFSSFGAMIWLGVVTFGLFTAMVNADSLAHNFIDRVLSAENLVLMTMVFAVMKLLHEFGHGMAVKRWGGEVHEMGIMLLVLIPVPYVDATAANDFPTRLRRIVVSSAGMYVEIFLAAIAIILWTKIEPGTTRAVLYNAAFIGSVSTVLFNLNPLLRFDGYYILSDLISIPNLGTRGTRYVQYLMQRYILRLDDATTPEIFGAEKRWFFVYTLAALCYRVFIVGLIAFFVATKLYFLGVLLALWAVVQLIVVPVVGGLKFLLFSPRLKQGRIRYWARAGAVCGAVAVLLFMVPAPRSTTTYGVFWVPSDGEIIANADGFVRKTFFAEGDPVKAGAILIETENRRLVARNLRLKARLRALEVNHRANFVSDRVALKLTQSEIEQATRQLAESQMRLDNLNIRAATDGRFALAVPEDLLGRYIRRGDRLGFVVDASEITARVAVGQDDIGLVRGNTRAVKVMSVEPGGLQYDAWIERAVPAASAQLPSMALSTLGGGDVAVVANENGGFNSLKDQFHFVIGVAMPPSEYRVGQKLHVKFVHDSEPIGYQAIRRLRQMFLSRLNV